MDGVTRSVLGKEESKVISVDVGVSTAKHPTLSMENDGVAAAAAKRKKQRRKEERRKKLCYFQFSSSSFLVFVLCLFFSIVLFLIRSLIIMTRVANPHKPMMIRVIVFTV